MWNYVGNYQWEKVALNADEVKGKWLQTVWQIDDSPRYASLGEWSSDHGILAWTSDTTYRPLPRRELTTRDDYDKISGVNRQALTANGWVHEQNNIKYDAKTRSPLAREFGVNEYKRVEDKKMILALHMNIGKRTKRIGVLFVMHGIQQNDVVGLRFTRQKEEDKQAHYMHFMDQAKAFSAKKAPEKMMQNEVKKLLNEQLTAGSVK